MKIAIAGTRGIPNAYGGFEQCAQYLSTILAEMGHEVVVYNSHYHSYQDSTYQGVQIVRKFNPELSIGTAGNFIYDFLCMRHAVRHKTDILLMLGYTTCSVFYPMLRFGNTALITNMDGLEWKRDKWNGVVKKMARWFEKLGAKHSPWLVSDNPRISEYLKTTYGRDSECIAYGCTRFEDPDDRVLQKYSVRSGKYGMVIARMEPENNIAMAIEGFAASDWDGELLIVGNYNTPFGLKMTHLASKDKRIRFTSGIYNQEELNSLRYYSSFYIHGHSVGGTNPSLLEAMACGCFLLIHGNEFNKAVVKGNALDFHTAKELKTLLNNWDQVAIDRPNFTSGNYKLIENEYNWKLVAQRYEALFKRIKGIHKGR